VDLGIDNRHRNSSFVQATLDIAAGSCPEGKAARAGVIAWRLVGLTSAWSKLSIAAHRGTDNRFPNDPMTSTFAPPIALAKLERDVRMKRLHRLLATLSMLCLATLGLATAARAYAVAPVGDPEALGFSSSRLARIAAWQQSQVDAGAFSGAVAAIARKGKVAYLRAVGFRDRAKTIPLQPDAIFWIASMTKPVTSVAAMMLVEEGKLDLAAPVHRYLPVRAQIRLQGVADLQVVNKDDHLLIEASGDLPVLDFEKGAAIPVVPMSNHEFFVDGGDHTRLAFLRDGAGPMRLVLNPGPWQITGQRIN
jgi:hypothetical protein